jgi:hypothetical protein
MGQRSSETSPLLKNNMNWTKKNAIKLSKKVSRPDRSARNISLDIRQSLFPNLPVAKEPEVLSPVLQSKTVSISSTHSSPVRVSLASDQEALFVTIEPGQKARQTSTHTVSPIEPVDRSISRDGLLPATDPVQKGHDDNESLVDEIEEIENQLHRTISDSFDQIRIIIRDRSRSKPSKLVQNGNQMAKNINASDFSEIGLNDHHMRATSELGSAHEEVDDTAVNINIDSSDHSNVSFDVGKSFFM